MKTTAPEPVEAHISGSTVATIAGYIARTLGGPAVDELLALAGSNRTASDLADTTAWYSQHETTALFDAAATLTQNPDVARTIGAELLAQHHGTEVAALLRSLGSTGELLANITATGAKYSTISTMEAVTIGDGHATVAATTSAGFTRQRHYCLYTAGVLAQANALFTGIEATVHETACQRDGAPACTYDITWDPASTDLAAQLEVAHTQLASLTERFEALQATSAALTGAGDVTTALEVITARAGLAVRAPQFILAVQLTGTHEHRVHTTGVTATEVDDLVTQILAPNADDHDGSRLIVDVATNDHHYGRLAAIYPPGARFLPAEAQLLESYAAHAAVALQTADALETARRRDNTARALLDLAHWLTEDLSTDAVADRACEATLAIADVDQAAVWLLDETAQTLTLAASHGLDAAGTALLATATITPDIGDLWHDMVSDPKPTWLQPDSAGELVGALLDALGIVSCIAVPLTTHNELYGIVVASVTTNPDRLSEEPDLLERLTGVARYTAGALRNARLVEEITYQATHDNLTGLPNARRLSDLAATALARAGAQGRHAALLFLDLDRFKQVNDTLGHEAGDTLLRGIGERIAGAVRATDTVARLSGDEFAVLIPDIARPDDAGTVAHKILDALQAPFTIAGQPIHASASIGVAVFPDDGTTYQELLGPADAAMYAAKRSESDGIRFTVTARDHHDPDGHATRR